MEEILNLKELIEMALAEDLGENGDVTAEAIFTDEVYSFSLVSKDEGILCGIEIFKMVMNRVDENIKIQIFYSDGDSIKKGDIVASVTGPAASILKGERTALNFLSHLSAIATKTALFVKEADGKAEILDTRKTLPGYRGLHKYAVRCGEGTNHRMGLYDMIMIKDNHADAAGGIKAAVDRVRAKWGSRYRIEVEARNLNEVKEALDCSADIIMLDNMSDDEMIEAVKLIAGSARTEASGNMSFERIKCAAFTGVDSISFGELTHTVKAFDFSLKELK
jgi:nicotinate-nucleotide pyrophosphorylase (carboxylating)